MMNIFYLIGVVIIIKFALSVFRRRSVDAKQFPINCNSEADIIDIIPSIEAPPEIPVDTPKSLGKNTWLYPEDDFGQLEKGKV